VCIKSRHTNGLEMNNHESSSLGKRSRNRDSCRDLTHENKILIKLLTKRLTQQVENILLGVQFSLQTITMTIHTVKISYTILDYVQPFNFQNGHNLIMKLENLMNVNTTIRIPQPITVKIMV
jgi:hypothetical protein